MKQDPFAPVVSLFQGLGQNIRETMGVSQPQQPGYLVTAASEPDKTSAGGNILLDLMNRAQLVNGSALVTAIRGRIDQMRDQNIVVMRLSDLLGSLNRSRRQTEASDASQPPSLSTVAPATADANPASETIDDVVKRLKDEKSRSTGEPPVAPGAPVASPGIVSRIPSRLFEGLDGLLGVGALAGDGMTGVLDSVTRLIKSSGGNVTVARAETTFGQSVRPESHGRSLFNRLEERKARLEERRRALDERLRERLQRRRSRGNDDSSVTKPGSATDPLPQADAAGASAA